jgi:anti-sigma factor RsiW
MTESMSNDPANDEGQLREELVAYLDGELSAEQSRQIEQRAAAEPNARRMLEELDRTWHMLDELDSPATNEDFTCTTLEMVALAAAEDAQQAKVQRPWRRLRAALWAVAGLVVAAAAGFLAVAWALPVLENYDQYRDILSQYPKSDSIDFLRALQKEKLFPKEAEDGR